MVGDDKKLFKELGNGDGSSVPLSPPAAVYFYHSPAKTGRSQSSSDDDAANNPLCAPSCSRKTHFYLVNTLNKSFHPDYDFSFAPSTDFSREISLNAAKNSVDSLLITLGGSYYGNFRSRLWEEIDKEICLVECEVYNYSPDLDSGPFSEAGVLWAFNYFFYNKKMKRIVYVCCIARSGYVGQENLEEDMEETNLEFDY